MSVSLDQPTRVEAAPPAGPADPSGTIVDIYPRTGWQSVRWGDLWEFRDLLWLLALRDVTIRYKQTVLGAAWAIIQPLLQTVVITVFFGVFMGMADRVENLSDGKKIPYMVFALAGQVLWTCFSATLTASSNSLLNNANMLRKIYFPRLLMPLSSAGAPSVDCAIGVGLLLSVMGWYALFPGDNHYSIAFSPLLLLTPLLILSTLLAALGTGILLSALTVAYRDFKYVVPFLIQIWFFVTPVIYPVKIFPAGFRWLLYLNPVAGTIEAFRGVVLGTPISLTGLGISTAASIVALLVGVNYFTRVERDFADLA